MDGGHDSASTVGETTHGFHDGEGLEAVESAGGLVQEEHRRVGDQLDPNGHTLALAAGDPACPLVPDDGVDGLSQAQVLTYSRAVFGTGEERSQAGTMEGNVTDDRP